MYKVTEKVVDLVSKLHEMGYDGTARLMIGDDHPYMETEEIMAGGSSLMLAATGKEELFLTQDMDTGAVVIVGRYGVLKTLDFDLPMSPVDVVDLAWNVYKMYRPDGYRMPPGWKELFIYYGYLKKVTKTITGYEEVK